MGNQAENGSNAQWIKQWSLCSRRIVFTDFGKWEIQSVDGKTCYYAHRPTCNTCSGSRHCHNCKYPPRKGAWFKDDDRNSHRLTLKFTYGGRRLASNSELIQRFIR